MTGIFYWRAVRPAAAVLALMAAGCATSGREQALNGDSALYADFLRGRYASLNADSASSALFYQSALRRAPEDQEILERAVTRTLVAGDVRAAAALEAAAEKSGSATSLGGLAIDADNIVRRKYHLAAKELPSVDDMGPFNRLIDMTLRAWAKVGQGDVDGGIAMLKASNSGSTLDRLTDYQMALVYDYAGRNAEARAAYERAWKSGLRLAVDVDAYGHLLERMGDRDAAVAVYDEFLANVGENPTIQASLERARKNQPAPKINSPAEGAAIAIFGPAAALTAQTGGEQAAAYLQLALYLDPNLDAARTLLAAGKAEAGRTEDSIDALRQVHPESPYFTTARIEMMWALARMDRNAEAVSAAEETVSLAPNLQTRLALADLHRSLEHWDDAAKLYDAEIKAGVSGGPEDQARIYFSRGTAYERLGRWPEAEGDLQKALALSPNDADILNYLGYSWIDRGERVEQGMALIQKAVALQPESGFIIDSLGWAQYRLGRFDEATATLEDAVELAPGETTINDHLGDAYWQSGRRIEARYQWMRALTLKPTDDERASLEKKLKTGLPDAPAKALAKETSAPPLTR